MSTPILEMRRLGHERLSNLSQGHILMELGFETGSLAPESLLLTTICIDSFSYSTLPAILHDRISKHLLSRQNKAEFLRSNLSKVLAQGFPAQFNSIYYFVQALY